MTKTGYLCCPNPKCSSPQWTEVERQLQECDTCGFPHVSDTDDEPITSDDLKDWTGL